MPLVALASIMPWRQAKATPLLDESHDVIQNVGEQVLEVLKSGAAQDEKFNRLVDLLNRWIDLDLVARLILARHWRTAAPAQREEYLKLFRSYALNNLASQLHIYEGQEFEVVSSRPAGKKDALVKTLILSNGRPPLHVDWRLREGRDGNLVAIDVIVESVSLIVTQRAEFGAVVERNGVEGLLKELRRRVDQAA